MGWQWLWMCLAVLAGLLGCSPVDPAGATLTFVHNSFYSNLIQENRYLLILDGLQTTVLISVLDGMTMAIVTHEMDFARDVASRVLYVDEGLIYEQGTPQQIFEAPQREKTRTFVNRIRSLKYQLTSPDYELYALNAGIEALCEKQDLPKATRSKLLLLVEELLGIYRPHLPRQPLDLTIAYSEKNENVELVCETKGIAANPLDPARLPDMLGLNLIHGLADQVVFQHLASVNRLTLHLTARRRSPAQLAVSPASS